MQTTSLLPESIYDTPAGMFNTSHGNRIDLNMPYDNVYSIEDIAVSLSNICRFGGHTKKFYSVAQHSVLVMHLAPAELKKEALMHDASEAYLGDVINPLKNILGEVYENIESWFMEALAMQFGFDFDQLEAIKPYDDTALELEYEALQRGNAVPLVTAMNIHGMMDNQQYGFWDNTTARVAFFEAAKKLGIA